METGQVPAGEMVCGQESEHKPEMWTWFVFTLLAWWYRNGISPSFTSSGVTGDGVWFSSAGSRMLGKPKATWIPVVDLVCPFY